MKRLFKYFVVLLALFAVCLTSVNAKESSKSKKKQATTQTKTTEKKPINVYLIRRSGCGFCAREMQFLSTLSPEYDDKINIIVYNSSESANSQFIQDVIEELKTNMTGVPFLIVGSEYVEGYTSEWDSSLKELFDKSYDNQVKDVVAGVIAKNNYQGLKATTLKEAMDEEGLTSNPTKNEADNKEDKKNNSSVIFLLIFAGCAGALGALIYFSRKDN